MTRSFFRWGGPVKPLRHQMWEELAVLGEVLLLIIGSIVQVNQTAHQMRRNMVLVLKERERERGSLRERQKEKAIVTPTL